MARRAVRLVALAVSAVGLWAVAAPAGATSERPLSATRVLEQGVLYNMNALRREHGLAPLRVSAALTSAARKHSTDMATRGYFSHTSLNGSSFDRRIARFYPMGHKRYWSVGENLLWSSPGIDAPSAIALWMASPEHKRNILTARWRDVGIAAIHADRAAGTYGGRAVTVITTDFGMRQ